MKHFNWEIHPPLGLKSQTMERLNKLLESIPFPKKKKSIQLKPQGNAIFLEGANPQEITYIWFNGFFLRDLFLLKEGRRKESIFGEKAYIRGVKSSFPTSAPLAEDIANHLIYQALDLVGIDKPDFLLLPFAGTGTFATELYLIQKGFGFADLPRNHNLMESDWFSEATLQFLQSKKQLGNTSDLTPSLWIDTDPALSSYWKKEYENWKRFGGEKELPWTFVKSSFLSDDWEQFLPKSLNNCFIPMNPPYGNRKEKREDNLYKNIGYRLENIVKKYNSVHFFGFLLCGSEKDWSEAMNALPSFSKKTIHITHSSDTRVLFFSSEAMPERS